MQMRNLLKANNRIKKSQTLLVGSLLVFIGIISLSWNYLLRMRDEVYSDMRIAMMDQVPEQINVADVVEDPPVVENVDNNDNNNNYVVDYSKYLGVLEIPKIGLKRGFYGTDSRYNSIEYNVTMVNGSSLPDVDGGNLILTAHSGDAWISYFAYLWRLDIGDSAFVTYNGRQYQYNIVNIYNVEKSGVLVIHRNEAVNTLTMITCTKDNDHSQTVYIAELVG